MGAPIHVPGMAGASAYTFDIAPSLCETVLVREWRAERSGGLGLRFPRHGWFAFWRKPDGVQIAYAGTHPADIPLILWREWFGTAHDLEFWNAARRPLTITSHPPKGSVH